jgi:hypothetical protein
VENEEHMTRAGYINVKDRSSVLFSFKLFPALASIVIFSSNHFGIHDQESFLW